ncbi:MAG: UDP-N-acetylmuramate dehydrogenase [Bacteroidales bacterium]|nr:UDP-N-acetylmuramate dehydrogenase [Bacteroidales bacterium]
MVLLENYSLKERNTFNVDANARYFISPGSLADLIEIINFTDSLGKDIFVLGGGSNVLFINDFNGLIIHPQLFGIEIVNEKDNGVLVKAAASENWDSFVEWTVNNGYCGLENLSLIPGTVGACPVQNIGAYGVEVAESIEKVEAIEILTSKVQTFTNLDCKFGYRNSIFKNELKNKFIITNVYFKLSKIPVLKTHYGAIENELNRMGEVNLINIRQAIIKIRESKLPDPEKIPNAGSFFKNPVITKQHYLSLKKKYPEMVAYQAENNQFKIAAGWMIDKLDWKGKQLNGAAVHENQALVLVNKQNASGKDIFELGKCIQKSVSLAFDINLEFEVNVIGSV